MLTFKKIKATHTELANTEVYLDGELLGYFLPNKSKYASLEENWNFVSANRKVQYFHSSTKEELIDTLNKQVNNEYVKLKQHFGIITELNKK